MLKIKIEDIMAAKEFFDSERQFDEFVANYIRCYLELPLTITNKRVAKYFEITKKAIKIKQINKQNATKTFSKPFQYQNKKQTQNVKNKRVKKNSLIATMQANSEANLILDTFFEQNFKQKLHAPFMAIYHDFFVAQTGEKPKITKVDGGAVKDLINYFHAIALQKDEEGIKGCFKAILNNWSKLDPYTQKRVKLVQINADINSIIFQLKNNKNGKQTGNAEIARQILARQADKHV